MLKALRCLDHSLGKPMKLLIVGGGGVWGGGVPNAWKVSFQFQVACTF